MEREKHRRFVAKRDIIGQPVFISDLEAEGRGMRLEELWSRAVLFHDIHELITTTEVVQPGAEVRDVSYVGFFEVLQGGSLRVGDVLRVNGRPIGQLAGFDLAHFPNHLNLVVRSERRLTGKDLGMTLEDEIRFTPE